jgi:hypothetical protein
MKKLTIMAGCAAALVAGMPAVAQTAQNAVAPAAVKHYNTQETAIGELLADPAAKTVLDAHIPGLSDDPSIGMASSMSLRAIQPMASDKITVAMLDAVDADLAKIPAK